MSGNRYELMAYVKNVQNTPGKSDTNNKKGIIKEK
jgi:hypothetical protein